LQASSYKFSYVFAQRGLDPMSTYADLIAQYDAPKLRPPFNMEARRLAGFVEAELAALGSRVGGYGLM